MGFYSKKRVLVTGGAGFIGSALVDKLITLGAVVTVGDNLSSGRIENLLRVWKKHGYRIRKTNKGYVSDGHQIFTLIDFQNYDQTVNVLTDSEIVFHLAANIGGRGYIDTHPADCCQGFSINQNVIRASHVVGVDRVAFASSACVYPLDLQKAYDSKYLLKEPDAFKRAWANADRQYGWAKLMGEQILTAYHAQYGLEGVSTRYVTAYGPWENDTHAIIALIGRAIQRVDPYVIWGSGKQDRDFTFIDDIVTGTLLAAEKITNTQAVNLGTSKRYTMIEATDMIFDILNWKPKKIIFDRSKPEGVKTRALDIRLSRKLMGWKPAYTLRKGLEETIRWYIKYNPKSVETL